MSGEVLLTRDTVDSWQREHAENIAKLAKLSDRNAELERLLKAASYIMEVSGPGVRPVSTPSASPDLLARDDSPAPEVTLVDAIVQVLKKVDRPQSNREIKRGLASTGFDIEKISKSPNYFYTATKRLVDREIIEKHPDGSYSIKNAEAPEGSIPGQGPSGASIERQVSHLTEPRAQGREAGPGGGT